GRTGGEQLLGGHETRCHAQNRRRIDGGLVGVGAGHPASLVCGTASVNVYEIVYDLYIPEFWGDAMTRRPVDHSSAPVVGYTDRFSLRPGENLTVFASSAVPTCVVRVLRVGPDGHLPVELDLPASVDIPHGTLDVGSYGLIDPAPPLADAVTFAAWVWLTALP